MIRVGIVGTGQMAATMVGAMRQTPDLSPVAICSKNQERAVQFAQSLELETGYGDLASFCEAGRLDAVYIANANADHAAAARACLEAGLPVFIEKPLALDATETKAIYELGRERGLLVIENLWMLALPAYRALKAALVGNEGTARLAFDFSLPTSAGALPGLYHASGGGVLLDRGVYGCAAALDLLGPVSGLSAHLNRDGAGIDTDAVLSLTHKSGAHSHITVSLDVVGHNALSVATPGAQLQLGGGLAAEHLHIAPYNASQTRTDALRGVGDGVKDRLKTLPVLRWIKYQKNQLSGQFHNYRNSPYSAILAELAQCLHWGRTGSELVPAALSIRVAELIEEARAK